MDRIEIYNAIKDHIDKTYGEGFISPIMYSNIEENIPTQCFYVTENVLTKKYKGLYKRFDITVTDSGEHK